MDDKARFLCLWDVGKMLGVHKSTIYKLVRRRKICAVRMGRKLMITRLELAKFIDTLPTYKPPKGNPQ